VAFVEHVPAVEPVPLPQLPEVPQFASTWQAVPAVHVPLFAPPPHVPIPQSVFLWHAPAAFVPLFVHVPPPQVPSPQLALELQAWPALQIMLLQVPEPHSTPPLAAEQLQLPPLQVSPVGQSELAAQVLSWHLPTSAPLQV
jgi:hypothetical protein